MLRAVAALQGAHAAGWAHERAQQVEDPARDQQLARSGALGRTPGPAGRLADVDQSVAAAQRELAGARARIAGLVADPALLGQSADRPAAAHPGVPRPESERRGPSLTWGAAPGLGR